MKHDREKWGKIRIRAVGVLFAVFFTVVIGRSFYLQVIKEEELVKIAERQHQRTVPLTPVRGAIYDSSGAPLAVSIEMDSCYAEPRSIEDIPDASAKLAPLLGIPAAELEKKIRGSKNFVWLQRRILPETARKIKELDLEGIALVKEPKRFYPNSEVASHVIGFTGMDPEGLEGIELKYDSHILGNTGFLITERDALGREISRKGTVVKSSSKGHSVALTLDKNIQYIAEKELAKAVTTSGARAGIAIVMEPQTGKVLAMANYPGFNPNTFSRFSPFALRNHAIADSFEPGSTFKVFLIAAALEERVISATDGFNCENGVFSIGGVTIHDTHRYGYLSVSDILKHSSNIGAAKIGRKLGQERLARYLRGFGIGEKSGIDLPGESPGSLRDRTRWFDADLATISFGQGVSSSAIQLAAGFSAIANGGALMKPYLVEKIKDENGTTVQSFPPQLRGRVVSQDTAQKVTKMMETVTRDGGTGTSAAVPGYSVAGKTGTAQKVDPVTHRYGSKRTASFIGFVPADNPRLTILVVVDEPKTSPYGGVVAAPAFSAIAQQSLCYLRVPPQTGKGVPPPVKPAASAEVAESASEGAIDYAGSGTEMPEFRGMSMRQVLRLMEKRGLNVKLIGSGRAVQQNPPSGRKISPDDQVWVRFAPAA